MKQAPKYCLWMILFGILCPALRLTFAGTAEGARATVNAVRLVEPGGSALIVIDGMPSYRHFTLADPPRIVVDVLSAEQSVCPSLAADQQWVIPFVGGSRFERARLGQAGRTVRVVFDLPVLTRYQVTRQEGGLLVSLPALRSDRQPDTSRAQPLPQPQKSPLVQLASVGVGPASSANPVRQSEPARSSAPPPAEIEVPKPATASPRVADSLGQSAILPTISQPIPVTLPAEKSSQKPDQAKMPVTAQAQTGAPLTGIPARVSPKDGRRNHAAGLKYEAQQEWELAAQHFGVAAAAEPDNPEYRLHLLRAQQHASILLAQKGDALAEAGSYGAAASAYRLAAGYDPANELARAKAARMVERQAAPAALPTYNTRTGGYLPAGGEIIPVQRGSHGEATQSIQFRDAHLRMVIEFLAGRLGLNVLFDDSFRDDAKFRIKLQEVSLASALDLVLLQSHHQFELVNRRTLLIYSDSPANRQRFEQLAVKTFYLGSADPNEVRTMIQQMTGVQRQMAVIKPLNALVVRDTPAGLRLVQELIESVDKNRAEVVVDVDIYEVSRSTSLEIGNQLALTATPVTATTTGADGKTVSTTLGNTAALGNLGGLGRAGGLAGVVAAPVLGGVGTLIGLPPSSLSLLQTKGQSRLLASTQVHALDGEQNQTKVGRSVPIRLGSTYLPGLGGQTSATPAQAGGFYGGAFDSIQYKDVGLVIDITPAVSNEGYVQLKMKLESTSVEATGADATLTPSFTQRSLSTLARVADGRTAVVAGIKQESKGESRAGLPVLSMLPLLGRFISTPRQNASLSDILITVTPHILRAPSIKQEDHLARFGGTTIGGLTQTVEEVVHRLEPTDRGREEPDRQPARRDVALIPDPPFSTEAPRQSAPANPAPADKPGEIIPAVATGSPSIATTNPAATPREAPPVVDFNLLPAQIETQIGETFFVMVSLYGQAQINEAQVSLRYDPTRLELVGVRNGGLFSSSPALNQERRDGTLQVRLQQNAGGAPIPASGQLLLYEFKALRGGPATLSLNQAETLLRASDGAALPFGTSVAVVSVAPRGQPSASNLR